MGRLGAQIPLILVLFWNKVPYSIHPINALPCYMSYRGGCFKKYQKSHFSAPTPVLKDRNCNFIAVLKHRPL